MDQLQNYLQQSGLSTRAFPLTSRYYGIEKVTKVKENGETVIYLRRRFIPRSDYFSLIHEHTVTQGDRLDNITNQYLGDPEQFWQLCDANDVLHPEELTQKSGSEIRITLPKGIPGNTNV